MEPSTDDKPTDKPTPRVLYDNGHDNKVFVGEGLPQPQFTHSQKNSNGNANYLNGNGHSNVNSSIEDMPQSYRVIENSRL